MKKIVVVFFFLSLGFYSNSQSNVPHPFPIDSVAWYDFTYLSWEYDLSYAVETNKKYYYNGFETVNGVSYNKVYATALSRCTGYCPGGNTSYYQDYFTSILLRTVGNKVYVIYDYDGQSTEAVEHLLYDYDIQVGDTFIANGPQGDPYPLPCVLIDSVLTNTGYRKQWNFIAAYCVPSDTLKWTEGITSNFGLFYDKNYIYCGNFYVTYNAYTQCFMHLDTFVLGDGYASCEELLNDVYHKPISTSISIFPNPATTEVTIKQYTYSQKLYIDLYSITGNLVYTYSYKGSQFLLQRSGLSAGIYTLKISDGKQSSWHKIAFTN